MAKARLAGPKCSGPGAHHRQLFSGRRSSLSIIATTATGTSDAAACALRARDHSRRDGRPPQDPPHRSSAPRLPRPRRQPLRVEPIGDRAVAQPLAPHEPRRLPRRFPDRCERPTAVVLSVPSLPSAVGGWLATRDTGRHIASERRTWSAPGRIVPAFSVRPCPAPTLSRTSMAPRHLRTQCEALARWADGAALGRGGPARGVGSLPPHPRLAGTSYPHRCARPKRDKETKKAA